MADFYQQVVQQEGDPRVFLNVRGEWFYYDTQSPPLGDGAMGTVYLGFSCNSNLRIAVKRVKDQYANNRLIRERAKQEASLSFSHPNLVQMIGLCEVAPNYGPIFILSAYVAGVTLDAHVQNQLSMLSEEDRVDKISREICDVLDALQYLHSRGVVHRDVKPSNIMIENGSVIKLMDLGIARLNGGNKYSAYGFIGTPQYAAPEQILRESDHTEIGAETDIYSTGVTFYELLTGNNPFKCEVEAEMLTRQITKKLPSDKKIPKRLFKVIQKATEKDPAKRYCTATEFKFAILEALEKDREHSLINWIYNHTPLSVVVLVLFICIIITILLTIC